MTQDLIDAAVELANTLARENEALARMDLARAASLLGAKRRAAEAFEQACSEKDELGAPAGRHLANTVEQQLATLADENRCLLERAIRAQGRVIGTIAGALARSAEDRGYRANGAMARRNAPALALSARA
jgi:hypothetical protein